MTTHELAGPFVSQGPLAIRGGRVFVAWKKPGEQRNTLFEVKAGVPVAIGIMPGLYYKDGGCSLFFDDVTNELCMLNFSSTDPTTGEEARPVLWRTGIIIAGVPAVDQLARDQANAATKIGKLALAKVEALAARVTALEG